MAASHPVVANSIVLQIMKLCHSMKLLFSTLTCSQHFETVSCLACKHVGHHCCPALLFIFLALIIDQIQQLCIVNPHHMHVDIADVLGLSHHVLGQQCLS